MVADWTGEDKDSDQLFFTKIYIDPAKKVSNSKQGSKMINHRAIVYKF